MGRCYSNADINLFSEHLFWDTDKDEIDINENAGFIISRALTYGIYEDWKIIRRIYGIEMIVELALKRRDIDKRSASYLAAISEHKKEEFHCYSERSLIPPR